MQAWINKDVIKFNDILAEDFLLSSSRGVWMNKPEWMSGAIGPFTCADFQFKEIRLRTYDNVAVVNAFTSQKASVGGADRSGDFMLTDVWVNKDGKWQVVARHGTGPLGR